jgi:hypothetical protein
MPDACGSTQEAEIRRIKVQSQPQQQKQEYLKTIHHKKKKDWGEGGEITQTSYAHMNKKLMN